MAYDYDHPSIVRLDDTDHLVVVIRREISESPNYRATFRDDLAAGYGTDEGAALLALARCLDSIADKIRSHLTEKGKP